MELKPLRLSSSQDVLKTVIHFCLINRRKVIEYNFIRELNDMFAVIEIFTLNGVIKMMEIEDKLRILVEESITVTPKYFIK